MDAYYDRVEDDTGCKNCGKLEIVIVRCPFLTLWAMNILQTAVDKRQKPMLAAVSVKK